MKSTLFTIPFEIGGVPIFGFGVLLAIWAAGSAILLTLLIRRQGLNRDTTSYLPVLLVIAAAIVLLPRFFAEYGGLPIRGYGVMVLAGCACGIAAAAYRGQKVGFNPDVMVSLCFWMIVIGIAGARVFYVIQYFDEFRGPNLWQTLVNSLRYTEGGLVVYGALIGGAIAFFVYVLKNRLPILALTDLLAPGIAIGIALGRIGCFLNGCCYGGYCDRDWAVEFPADSPPYNFQVASGQFHGFTLVADSSGQVILSDVRGGSAADRAGLVAGDVVEAINAEAIGSLAAAGRLLALAVQNELPLEITTPRGIFELDAARPRQRSLPAHPTQLYSAINGAVIAWLLWTLYPYRRADGQILAAFMILYSMTRFLLERVRTDEAEIGWTHLTISQNISLAVFLGGLTMTAILWRQRNPRLALPPEVPSAQA